MDASPGFVPRRDDALLVIDVQDDFVRGSLAVPGAAAIVPIVDGLAARFARLGLPVVASRDWHPPSHVSFREQGGPWPAHCVRGTAGAGAPPGLELPSRAHLVLKGTDASREAYSAFEGTDLESLLRTLGVRRVVACGLATDYCVRATVLDARRAGFEALVLTDAIRAVDARPGDGEAALEAMRAAGTTTALAGAVREAKACHG